LLAAIRTSFAFGPSRNRRASSHPRAETRAARCIVVVPKTGSAMAARPFLRGSTRSRSRRGGDRRADRLPYTRRMSWAHPRRRAAKEGDTEGCGGGDERTAGPEARGSARWA
jgi:hypothetical protein